MQGAEATVIWKSGQQTHCRRQVLRSCQHQRLPRAALPVTATTPALPQANKHNFKHMLHECVATYFERQVVIVFPPDAIRHLLHTIQARWCDAQYMLHEGCIPVPWPNRLWATVDRSPRPQRPSMPRLPHAKYCECEWEGAKPNNGHDQPRCSCSSRRWDG